MYLMDLIKSYREKLIDNPNDYSCLLFALQIPSICSRIEIPKTKENTGESKDGKFYGSKGRIWDGNIYKAWLRNHKNNFVNICGGSMGMEEFCKNLYELRCKMTHEGVVMTGTNHFFFIEGNMAMLIDYFVAFRVFYYDYIYQIQTKGKSIAFLFQSAMTAGASVAFSRFIDDILKLESITGVLYYCIFLCITFPIWLFFIELFFLLKDANTYRTISKDETKFNFKKYINKTILSNSKKEIGFIIIFIIILIYLLYNFYFT